ncbi:MAG TPA: tRNA (adenosine(37)-N6)-threonylcarbamoyltransferase complex dimerization subunit type 1 TsaB [Sphingomonas sp.]|nr:tRNA (adenosine(37)-N6)-threonylcarbamoyltransferase complex dimerization subunit type 1 TsaB [Sphingomonas sp.]
MLLAIDTATANCSAALIEGDRVIAARAETVGRGHAERLVPMIAELLSETGAARPDALLVDCGPGSFTGVRVGLAAAIGLGLGWGAPVSGFSSLALIAASLFARRPELEACAAALSGGHGELFVQRFAARPFATLSPLASLPPIEAAAAAPEPVVAGSGAAALIVARGAGEAIDLPPAAADARLLPPAFRALPARPIYGRAPDARPAAA